MPKRKSFYDTLRSAARRLFVDLRKAAPTPTNIAKYEKRVRAKPTKTVVYKYRVGYYDGKKVVPQPAKIYPRQPIVSKKKVPRRLVESAGQGHRPEESSDRGVGTAIENR